MTSTTDTAEHPEVTELSDLTEGLLPPSRTSDVRQHLDECPLCADVYASLEEIRGMLGTLPGPPRMPAEIAGRIDAALAAEALLSATTPQPGAESTATSTSSPSPKMGEDNDAHVSRETAPTVDRPAGRPRAATGPGRPDRKRRARRRTLVLGTVFTAAALGLGTLLVQSMGDNDPGAPEAAHSQDVSTFSGDSVKNQVARLLAETRQKGNPPGNKDSFGAATKPGTPGSTADGHTLSTTNVPACITKGIGRLYADPLASKEGEYKGAAAYLVVLPDASRIDRVIAYVVDAACVGKTPAPPGDVLAKHSYPRSTAVESTGP